MIDILFAIDISEKNYRKEWSGQGQTLKLLSWFKIWIMLYYLKWIREHREREIEQLISANSWYNTVLWLVSKSQTVLWLAWWTFNRWISKVETDRQTHKQTHRQTYFISPCWTALSQLKKNYRKFHNWEGGSAMQIP